MSRYQILQYESELDVEHSWLILDTKSDYVARFNGIWLERLTEPDAKRLAALLNWVESDGAKLMVH